MLPVAFENDDGQKEAWRKALRERLMELGEQEESGSLRGGDAQNPAYRASLEGYTHKPVSILPPESGGGGGGAAASDGAADAGASDAFDQGAAAQRELEALRGRGLGGIQAENQQLKGAAAPPWAGQAKPKPKKKPALPARDRGGGGGGGGGPPPPPGPPPPMADLEDRRGGGGGAGGRAGGDGGRSDLLAAIARRRVD